mmetsp:Transcript_36491/g.145871  ORF Transcript_36491/g.145871 Transcript_36491/m.145871 type:complete len:501 (-) Transcript_36491:2896-4398(-)
MGTRVVLNSFYLDERTSKSTPSRKDGVSEVVEKTQRAFACGLIQEAGILLELPQIVMATAQVLFHRFYHRVSMKKFSHLWTAAAALFLAAKVEENPRRVREVVTTVHHRLVKNEIKSNPDKYKDAVAFPVDLNGTNYFEWKFTVARTEMYILKELGFVLHVEHPHKFILIYVNTMKEHSNPTKESEDRWKSLLQNSWNNANDALRTDVCVRYEPEVIACACIRLATKTSRIKLPDRENAGWWLVFGVSEDALSAVEAEIDNIHVSANNLPFEELTKELVLEDIMREVKKSTREDQRSRGRSLVKDEEGVAVNGNSTVGTEKVPVRVEEGDTTKRPQGSDGSGERGRDQDAESRKRQRTEHFARASKRSDRTRDSDDPSSTLRNGGGRDEKYSDANAEYSKRRYHDEEVRGRDHPRDSWRRRRNDSRERRYSRRENSEERSNERPSGRDYDRSRSQRRDSRYNDVRDRRRQYRYRYRSSSRSRSRSLSRSRDRLRSRSRSR